ncbi:hypothetical protein ACFQ0D_18005, partial [Micromonospora zhanjiangensis]
EFYAARGTLSLRADEIRQVGLGELLDLVWTDDVQRARALAGLVQDGLVERAGADAYTLAGDRRLI